MVVGIGPPGSEFPGPPGRVPARPGAEGDRV